MTPPIPSFDVSDLAQPANELADELDACLGKHKSPELCSLAESLWNQLQATFDIPTDSGVKRVYYPNGLLEGTRKPLDDRGREAWYVWKDEKGNEVDKWQDITPAEPLHLRTHIQPPLMLLFRLDQCALDVRSFCGLPQGGIEREPTTDTVSKLRTVAEELSRKPDTPYKTNFTPDEGNQPAVAGLADGGETQADPKAPYMPASWFKDEFGITAEALRGQAKRGNLKKTKRDYWNLYSVSDAQAIWPGEMTYDPETSK